MAAAGGEALDELLHELGAEHTGGDVVHEEEGTRALDEDVVDAVADDVSADGVVAAHHGGDHELGADAVGGGDEEGVVIGKAGEGEHGAEGADIADDLGGESSADVALGALQAFHLAGDVHAGGGVGEGDGTRWLPLLAIAWHQRFSRSSLLSLTSVGMGMG